MKIVHEYSLFNEEIQTIPIHSTHKALYVECHPNDMFCIWVEEDTDSPECLLDVFVVGAGCKAPQGACNHVGSFITTGDCLVFHVYTGAMK